MTMSTEIVGDSLATVELVVLTRGPKGDPGDTAEVYLEFQVSVTHIQYRTDPAGAWVDLIPLSEFASVSVPIELQTSATHLQWRYQGDTDWIDAVLLTDLLAPHDHAELYDPAGTAASAVSAHDTDERHISGTQAADIAAAKAHVDQSGNAHGLTGAQLEALLDAYFGSPIWRADPVSALASLDTSVTGAELDALKTKVDSVESGAKDDQTANEIEALLDTYYGNTDWRTGGTGTSDHGALTGLSDDDHSQYHTDARGDARYYTQAQVDAAIPSTPAEVDADPVGTAANAVSAHDTDSRHFSGTDKDDLAAAKLHTSAIGNPHSVTAADVGLGNVNNTADADKPISTATQTALNAKSDTTHDHAGVYDPVGTASAAVSAHDTDAKHFTGTQAQDLADAKAHADIASGNPHGVTPAGIGAAATGDLPTAMSEAEALAGTDTTPRTIAADVLDAKVNEPTPRGAALTDIGALVLDRSIHNYTLGTHTLNPTAVDGGWAIVIVTGGSGTVSANSGIQWTSGDVNDLVVGAELLVRCYGSTIYASVGVPA